MAKRLLSGEPLTITICGGGNAAHVLVALLGADPKVTVRLYDQYAPEIPRFEEAFAATGSVIRCQHNDEKPDTLGKCAMVSNDAAAAIPGTDLYLIAVPAFDHDGYLKAVAPYLTPDLVVGCMVAEGGYDYALRDAFGEEMYHKITHFAMETLPWACRILDYGKSGNIKGVKGEVCVSSSPKSEEVDVLAFLNKYISIPWEGKASMMPKFTPNGGYLSATLMNINAWFHPAVMYGEFKGKEQEEYDEPPPFYQGVGPVAESTLLSFSDELMAIKAAVLAAKPDVDLHTVMPISDFFFKSYEGDIGDTSGLGAAMRTNKGYQGLKHTMKKSPSGKLVGDWNARYFTEDIPYGLVSIKGVAEVVNVPTPVVDEVIAWSQALMGKEYIVDGKLTGKDIAEARCPQAHGWHTLEHAFV